MRQVIQYRLGASRRNMGKLQEFEIAFDKNKVVYSPGESISGTVTIKVGQALPCKAIKVNCNGFCGITSKVNDTTWMMEEQYFNSTVSVADKGTLKQGEHTFPFKFLIPATAPTSFEGNYGRIIYRVRAFIDTPRFAKDYNKEKAFYMLSPLNLNEVPDIWGICSSAVTQQFTYMLVKTGTVVLKAQTDMKGYTPGQIIQVTADIHNQSGKNTGNMAASLVQRVTYEMKKPTHDMRTIAEVEGGVVKAGKEVQWKEQIIIPLFLSPPLLAVSLKSPDVMLTLPIHIGNVSLDKKRKPSKKTVPSTSAVAEGTPAASASASASASAPASTSASAPAPDASTSATAPMPTARPAPKPAPRPTPRSRMSSHSAPSAPPADYDQGAEEPAAQRAWHWTIWAYIWWVHWGLITYAPENGTSSSAPHILPPDYGASSYPQ
ncbi:hypothetical protein INR49_028021, partial [Caranx melampygus]